jgi:CTP:molybdopterin cytidylyltransferase MocA
LNSNSNHHLTEISACVLAAGQSRRFGSPKLLAHFRGQPLFWWTLDALLGLSRAAASDALKGGSTFSPILYARTFVVLGANADEMEASLSVWRTQKDSQDALRLRVLRNACYREGQGTSLALASKSFLENWHSEESVKKNISAPTVPGMLTLLGDQPLITELHLQNLAKAFLAEGRIKSENSHTPGLWAAASRYENGFGVPALVSPSFVELFAKLKGDQGARGLLQANSAFVSPVDFSGSLLDIDTVEDLKAAEACN